MMKKSLRQKAFNIKGFTLIELLVVIAIIGLLSTMTVYAINVARMKARDARRLADMRQLQKAVELYYDEYGSYPSTGGSWWGEGSPCYGNHDYSGSNGWIPNLAPEFMGNLPGDPKPNLVGNDCYLYRSDGTDYMIMAHFTMETICGGDPSNTCNPPHIQQMDRRCCTQPTIAVYSPGAINW
jgi:general secretion pathway protein G